MNLLLLGYALLILSSEYSVNAFVVRPREYYNYLVAARNFPTTTVPLLQFSSSPGQDQDQDVLPIESMRLKEIQAELKQRKVSYSDCFDKESLVQRLKEARETTTILDEDDGEDESSNTGGEEEVVVAEVLEKEVSKVVEEDDDDGGGDDTDNGNNKESSFDRDAKLSELRSMKVRTLKEECAKKRIRWGQFVEKEEFVQALIEVLEKQVDYSISGSIIPGEVADLTADELEQELSEVSEAPLLLDIYATWCGPCQMMAPHLKDAALELGSSMRVAKIDSDKYPQIAQKLRAGGLPTVLVLNGSDELQRIEGAMMKDQILQFVAPYTTQ